MTDADRELIRLINRRVAALQPDVARAMRLLYARLVDEVGAQGVVNLIQSGRIDDIISEETLERATAPIRQQLRDTMARGFRLTVPDVATLVRVPVIDVSQSLLFDVLNPRVTKAITTLESRTLDTLKANVRQSVRESVAAGLLRGEHPTAIARELRTAVGLSPQQLRFVQNAGDDLRTLDTRYFTRELRDKRYDATVRKAVATGTPLSPEKIDTITAAYGRKYTKYNTEINTRAATLDAYRLAQWESYASAIDRGIVPADLATKEWVHFDEQAHPRLDHQAWGGTIVGFYDAFPDGQQQAGLGYFGCHCSTRYGIRRQAAFPAPIAA